MNRSIFESGLRRYKVVLLGPTCAGKSSLVNRLIMDKFFTSTDPTIGAAFFSQEICVDEKDKIVLEIWDTAGQERYRSLSSLYYRGANAVIVCFDLTSQHSFKKALTWLQDLGNQQLGTNCKTILVGNKKDLVDNRQITQEQIDQITDQYQIDYRETSALTGDQVEDLFLHISRHLILEPSLDHQTSITLNEQREVGAGGWTDWIYGWCYN